jgi:hypothetical protein
MKNSAWILLYLVFTLFFSFTVNAQEGISEDVNRKEMLAKEGKAEDFDIRGIKVTMNIDEMEKYADDQGWNHAIIPNVINTLAMCPKGFDCKETLTGEPSGSFRLNVMYEKDTIYAIRYETQIKGTFSEISKLILDKYGKPLKRNSDDKDEYFYGVSTEEIRKNTKSIPYHNFLREHVLELRLKKWYENGAFADGYVLSLHLGNPPKIDPNATKPIAPAL